MATVGYPTIVPNNGTSIPGPGDYVGTKITPSVSGPVTQASVHAAAFGGTALFRLAIYDTSGNRLWQSADLSTASTTHQWHNASVSGVTFMPGQSYWMLALHKNTSTASSLDAKYVNSSGNRVQVNGTLTTFPATLTFPASPTVGYYFFKAELTENVAPPAGTWRTVPNGPISNLTPLFEGNMPHGTETADFSQEVELQIYNSNDPSIFYYNNIFVTTSTERTQGYFSRSPVTLPADTPMAARFRHRDSFGVWSVDWSPVASFVTGAGPALPTGLVPNAKINAVSAYNYSALYGHTSSLNAVSAQIRLYNSTGSTVLYDSGEYVLPAPVAPNNTVTVNEASLTAGTPANHPTLAWATGYMWDVRFKDSAGAWGAYAFKQAFNTNAVPNVPTNLQPSGDAYTPTRTLTASISDPDNDPVTAADIEIANADTNVVLTGYPKSNLATIDNTAKTVTFTVPEADVVLGTRYKWRARVSDGHPNSPGAWSAYVSYRYQNVPLVSATVPDPTTTHAPSFTATYNHNSALARTHRRTVLQRLDNGVWVGLYDSGWVAASLAAGLSFQITFPANTVRNRNRYRVKEYARDTGLGEGETPYYEFSTAYAGPPTLNVTVAQAIPSRAEISLEWDASTLTPQQFAGIEVKKEAEGERTETVHVSFDPATTSYVYAFPRSNVPYTLSVRQVENRGVEQVEGEWAVSTVTCDYAPYSFIKDTTDPGTYYAAFDTTVEDLAAIEEDSPLVSGLPWGQSGFSHDFSNARLRSGEVVAEFHPDALNIDPAETRYERVRTVVNRRRAMCLLPQLPDPEKVFIAVAGPASRGMLNVVTKQIRFPWQETLYSEDYYERNGIDR